MKWFVMSKTYWGIGIMLLSQILGENSWVAIENIIPFLEGILQTGAFTVGAALAMVGRKTADTKVTLFPPPKVEG